ncbi:MAG: YibE/F family protein [Anaerostipes hadrus]
MEERNIINLKFDLYNALHLFIFLPMIYKGISPILAAVLVVAFTTVVTMCMVDGITKKSVAAMLGTIIGVVFSGAFALIFGQVT